MNSKEKKRLAQASKNITMHIGKVSESTLLIKPGVDASDKEINYRNFYSHMAQNLGQFMTEAYNNDDVNNRIFKPRRMG